MHPRSFIIIFRIFLLTMDRTGENASQATGIENSVHGAYTVTANYVQFWFRRFRPGIFDVKNAPRTDKRVVETVDNITEIERNEN
ncbi:hypothetical protein TNCV_1129001 [Trichonephila clavipes]|nr:hypothetical protein TNCV_1129001 [Trichonephila clavipes]